LPDIRAEVADVTNAIAIYGGADCVMLSGETAKEKYPVQTIQMMNEIISSAEHFTSILCPASEPSSKGEVRERTEGEGNLMLPKQLILHWRWLQ
jgi:pyruvate kinase